jgi:hypothetical protein
MDGNQEPTPQPPIRAAAPPPADPQVKTFKCRGCGNPLTLRGMDRAESVVCEACGSVIDLTDENLRIISTFQSKIKYKPLIPLGSRGKVRGEMFEIIGYMRRAMTVEGVDYEWNEYLLFNPYKGFRWLSEYNGHWNFLKATSNIPKPKAGGARPAVKYLDQPFLHFQTAEARVIYVLGEFYWKVQAEEKCQVTDYVAPPLILSREKTDQEITWAIGEYIEPGILWSAFHLNTPIPPKIGVAPNQPSPYATQSSSLLKLFVWFCVAAMLIHLLMSLLAQNKLVYENRFVFRQADKEKGLVTDFFEIPGHTSNVVVKSTADVNNNWIYLHMTLIHEEGRAYDFGKEISYYHGVDDGERWSEGSISDEAILPAVPAGKYYLYIGPESSAPSVNYAIRVYRDVPQWSFLLLALAALCFLPFIMKWRSSRFEAARWAESDPPRSKED